MHWKTLLSVVFTDQGSLSVEVGPLVIAIVVVSVVVWAVRWRRLRINWTPVEGEISLGSIGKVKLKPSLEDRQLAHQAWVELATRKAGLAFDEDSDVISEVYDSWYQLFGELRQLARQVPAERVSSSEETKQLVDILVNTMNQGLRPHLTKWQARLRHFVALESAKYTEKSPQENQRAFPEYQALVSELKTVNQQLIQYRAFLEELAHGKPKLPKAR